jgi:hypothetical protein
MHFPVYRAPIPPASPERAAVYRAVDADAESIEACRVAHEDGCHRAGVSQAGKIIRREVMRFGTCFTTSDLHPTLAQLHALRSVGITDMRLSIDTAKLCPESDPATWQWASLDTLIAKLHTVGIEPYLNPVGCPSWASAGQPAFVGFIPGTCWWNAPGHRDANGEIDEAKHGIHYFDQDSNRTDTRRDDVTGHVYSGAELAAIDQQQPPRPYLVNPPKMDPTFWRAFGSEIMQRYSPTLVGVGNEYGDEMFNPWVRKDISRDGSVDMIREHLMPEMIEPFFAGANLGTGHDPLFVGPDADSDIIMQRCGTSSLRYDILAGHMYGDFDGMSYSTTEAFLTIASGHELWCTEIDAATPRLLEWTKERCAKKDIGAIYYLRPGMFFEGDGYAIPNDPVVSAEGQEFARVMHANGPVDPLVTTMPVRRRAARS